MVRGISDERGVGAATCTLRVNVDFRRTVSIEICDFRPSDVAVHLDVDRFIVLHETARHDLYTVDRTFIGAGDMERDPVKLELLIKAHLFIGGFGSKNQRGGGDASEGSKAQ